MISRQTKVKLGVFVALTCVSLSVLFFGYMRGAERAGFGVYDVTMRMTDASDLYPNAQVSYRGVKVGAVRELEVGRDGVTAHLSLDSDRRIPTDVDAHVHSTSAIGEQYIDLVARPGSGRAEALKDGSEIPSSRVSVPVSTAALLHQVQAVLGSVSTKDISTTVDALATGFGGTADELDTLLDSSLAFQRTAHANLAPTMQLLDDVQTVLHTQDATAPQVATYLRELRRLTNALVRRDGDLRALVKDGSPFLKELDAELSRLRPDLAPLLADTWTTANVASTYDGNIEHTLTLLPALFSALQAAVPLETRDAEMPLINLSFKLNLNDPPLCTEGFPEHSNQRSPHELSAAPPPNDVYCKVAGDDPRIVRGARNIPCPNGTGRGARPDSCGLTFPRYQDTAGQMRGAGRLPTPVALVDPSRDVARTRDGTLVPLASLATGDASTGLSDLLVPVLDGFR